MGTPTGHEKAVTIADRIAAETNTDVFVYNAPFSRGNDTDVIAQLRERKKRDNVLLVLTSSGGDADAAYRISRAFQSSYTKFSAFVPGWCKSAGTLCVLGAHEVIISDFGELGPLDVQLRKKDEIDEYGSGLAVTEALSQVQQQAFQVFERYMLRIKQKSLNSISFKLAAELAARMAVDLYEPISKQIDPVSIGDFARAMTIAQDYGRRLKVHSQNFTDEMLRFLVESYPSHGFVIDRMEATAIFKNAREPTPLEQEFADALGEFALIPSDDGIIEYYSSAVESDDETSMPDQLDAAAGTQANHSAGGAAGDAGNLGGAEGTEAA